MVTNNKNVHKNNNIMCYDYICDNDTLVLGIATCVKIEKNLVRNLSQLPKAQRWNNSTVSYYNDDYDYDGSPDNRNNKNAHNNHDHNLNNHNQN